MLMAQRFWSVYLAIRDKTDLLAVDFDPFVEHVRWELITKVQGYGATIDEFTTEELLHHIIAEVADGIAKANFDPKRNTFKNWVDGLVRNVVRKYFRFRATPRGQQQSLDELMENDEGWGRTESSPETLLLDDEAMAQLKRALQRLEREYPQYYEVLRYRCFYELSTEGTAKLLNDDPANISRRLHRARTKLREILEIKGGD